MFKNNRNIDDEMGPWSDQKLALDAYCGDQITEIIRSRRNKMELRFPHLIKTRQRINLNCTTTLKPTSHNLQLIPLPMSSKHKPNVVNESIMNFYGGPRLTTSFNYACLVHEPMTGRAVSRINYQDTIYDSSRYRSISPERPSLNLEYARKRSLNNFLRQLKGKRNNGPTSLHLHH